jgi:hypothetical protein
LVVVSSQLREGREERADVIAFKFRISPSKYCSKRPRVFKAPKEHNKTKPSRFAAALGSAIKSDRRFFNSFIELNLLRLKMYLRKVEDRRCVDCAEHGPGKSSKAHASRRSPMLHRQGKDPLFQFFIEVFESNRIAR